MVRKTKVERWIDAVTHTDTIITNVSANPNLIYYAIKNWQSIPDNNYTIGLRNIVERNQDSIVVNLEANVAIQYLVLTY